MSPFLFVMRMSIVMDDAFAQLPKADKRKVADGSMSALLYVGDALLLGNNRASLERLLAAVRAAGAPFGLELHADKFQFLQVVCTRQLRNGDGSIIPSREDMVYLGALITDNGRMQKELAATPPWSSGLGLQSPRTHLEAFLLEQGTEAGNL